MSFQNVLTYIHNRDWVYYDSFVLIMCSNSSMLPS